MKKILAASIVLMLLLACVSLSSCGDNTKKDPTETLSATDANGSELPTDTVADDESDGIPSNPNETSATGSVDSEANDAPTTDPVGDNPDTLPDTSESYGPPTPEETSSGPDDYVLETNEDGAIVLPDIPLD